MLKKAICSALSQAIHKEPIVVQKSMFQVMSNGATQLTDAGKFVTKRLFVEALDKVFSGGILERLTGSITQLTSLTMGPFAAAGAFLGDLASGALKDVFEIYSKQAFLTHYLNANGAALHKLIFGSCIEQPVVVEVSKEATLAAIASTMTSAQASITKAVSPVGWYKWAAQAKVSNENELKKVNQAIATANQKNRVLKPIQPQQ